MLIMFPGDNEIAEHRGDNRKLISVLLGRFPDTPWNIRLRWFKPKWSWRWYITHINNFLHLHNTCKNYGQLCNVHWAIASARKSAFRRPWFLPQGMDGATPYYADVSNFIELNFGNKNKKVKTFEISSPV